MSEGKQFEREAKEVSQEGLDALRVLSEVEGATLYYFYMDGGAAFYGKGGGRLDTKIQIGTFLELQSAELIDKSGEVGKETIQFAQNTKCHKFTISEKGRELLEKSS